MIRLIITTLWTLAVPMLLIAGPTTPASDPALDDTLLKGFTFFGQAVDANGMAVAGAKVCAYGYVSDPLIFWSLVPLGKTTTGVDGRFCVKVKEPGQGSLIVTITKERLGMSWMNCALSGPNGGVVKLGPPADCAGMVVNEANGPVGGASVEIRLPALSDGGLDLNGRGRIPELITKTDEHGRFRFTQLPTGSIGTFVVRAAGAAPLVVREAAPSAQPYRSDDKDIRLVLKPEGRIQGTLLHDGKPVAGVNILAYNSTIDNIVEAPIATTDMDGRFTLANLRAGEHLVRTFAATGNPDFLADGEPVKVEAGKTTANVIVPVIKGGLLRVTLRDSKGRPAVGFPVHTTHPQEWRIQRAPTCLTNDMGIATFRVLPGQCYAYLAANGYHLPNNNGVGAIVKDDETVDVEAVVEPNPRITGIVLGPDGKGLNGVSVCLYSQNNYSVEGTTDEQGRLDMIWMLHAIPPGGLTLACRHMALGMAGIKPVDNPDNPIELTLKPAAAIAGQVVDDNGKPVAKARVYVHHKLPGQRAGVYGIPEAITDEKGNYSVRTLPPDEYDVCIWAKGYGPGIGWALVPDGNIAATDANRLVAVDKIALETASLTIAGVVNDIDGRPVAGVTVWPTGERQGPIASVFTNKEGRFTLTGLVPEKLHVNAQGSTPSGFAAHGAVDVEAGATDVEIIIIKPGEKRPPKKETPPPGVDF